MTELIVALPAQFEVDGPVQGQKTQVSTKGFEAAFITYLAQYGWNVIMQRCTSTIKKEEEPEEWQEERDETFAGLSRGEIPSGEGASRSRQSPQVKGWIEYLKEKKHKEDKKIVTGNTLKRAQETLCRRDLVAKAGPPGSPERKEVEANIGKHLAERFHAWKAWKETADPDLAEAIAEEIRKAEKKKQKAKPIEVDLANASF